MKSASIWHFVLSLTLLTQFAVAQVATDSPTWLPRDYRYDKPLFETSNYDPQIPTPDKLLGYRLGDRPATHAEVQRCFKAWDEASPRMTLTDFGSTHERRTQTFATITSGKNHAQLADIRGSIAKLADPRKLKDQAEADRIIRDTPAIAWLAYCIHGDEMSGTDAALAVVYHLIASRDREVEDLLEKTVICVDPIQNPDGRDRFIKRLDEFEGYTPVLDRAAIAHAGSWPYGRTNHYLFDLNRDWIYSVHPETRNRQRMIAAWTPQLFVDSHEMGPEDSFLFNPAREPFNPGLSPTIRKWWNTFANDAGAAFDQHGWSYYSREWADFWYPGYSDGWACLHGAIGILYEQARTGGRPILLPTGRILTYREAVHHQATCTMANLNSLLRNRVAVLTDFAAARKAAVAGDDAQPQTFLLNPTTNRSRVEAFVEYLTNQGVEVSVATQPFEATGLVNTLREQVEKRQMPAGTIIVQRRQPLGPLVSATLDFDPRMDKEFLDSERRELETKRTSRLYDITGWSPPMAWDLDAYWSTASVTVAGKPYEKPSSQPSSADSGFAKPYAYVIDVADDSWRRCLTHLLNAGIQVRVAEKEFRAGGRSFNPGSLLVRRHENDENAWPRVLDAAKASGAQLFTAGTARSPDETPDLGGQHFILLQMPRVALVGGNDADTSIFGATWHMLDRELGLPTSIFVSDELDHLDLRRHNVLILAGGSGGKIAEHKDDIETFLRAGGTVIAIDSSTELFTGKDSKLSAVRDRTDIVKDDKGDELLTEYASAVALERAAGKSEVDPAKLWENIEELVPPGAEASTPETKLTRAALDEWRSIFSSTGVIVRAETNQSHWITFGLPPEVPVYAAGSRALLSKPPVATPVRLATPKRLRLSGLLWPEAAQRMGDSAYVTVEHVGAGQLILFAHDVNFRGAYRGANQLLINAVLLAPGCGASAPSH